jgi:hypothetical protein
MHPFFKGLAKYFIKHPMQFPLLVLPVKGWKLWVGYPHGLGKLGWKYNSGYTENQEKENRNR